MRTSLLALAIAAALSLGGVRAEEQRGKTAGGKDVILRDDGTWAYAEPGKKAVEKAGGEYAKDKKAELAYTGKRGTFTLTLVPDAWKPMVTPLPPGAEVGFLHAEGDIGAVVVAERIEIPMAALKKLVLDNVRNVDPEAKVLLDEKRTVNGRPVVCLTVDATVSSIALTYHIYLYSGDEASIQVLTWTGRKLFKENKADMEAFLNGFEVVKKGE